MAFESLPAVWRHDLSSTVLNGYRPGEYYIVSHIYTGRLGFDAVQRHGLELKVAEFDRPFSKTLKSYNGEIAESFEVTLHEMPDPKEMRADYDSIVYKNGKQFLRFSGSTILRRP